MKASSVNSFRFRFWIWMATLVGKESVLVLRFRASELLYVREGRQALVDRKPSLQSGLEKTTSFKSFRWPCFFPLFLLPLGGIRLLSATLAYACCSIRTSSKKDKVVNAQPSRSSGRHHSNKPPSFAYQVGTDASASQVTTDASARRPVEPARS
jgi:hypothetical protein